LRSALPLLALAVLTGLPGAGRAFDVRYEARIFPDTGMARLSIAIDQPRAEVTQISFGFDPERLFDETGPGELRREGPEGEQPAADADGTEDEARKRGPLRLVWRPPAGGGVLRYSLRVDRLRSDAEYDARCASSWMVARAEDLFPPMTVRFMPGAEMGRASLQFKLPPRWKIAHPFETQQGVARVEQEHRRFDQPKGWIVAGSIDRIEGDVAETHVTLAAPSGHHARLRDLLAFLHWTLPELQHAFGELPDRILVASASDPMWRGGLSAPGSVYLHADRPFIDRDGSSPLLHELVHTLTRARSAPGEDWIVEGLAEYYSREMLRRSGAISQEVYDDTLRDLRRRAARVKRLVGEATGSETALAVAFFYDLDREIRESGDGDHSLDDVVATLVGDVTAMDRPALLERISATTGFDASALMKGRIPPSEAVAHAK
jgi:hypothetical protein